MTPIITLAYLSVLGCALFVLLRYPRLKCRGESPVGLFTLIALLFTAGLDMGGSGDAAAERVSDL